MKQSLDRKNEAVALLYQEPRSVARATFLRFHSCRGTNSSDVTLILHPICLRRAGIALQGILYVSAFYITWFFPSLQRVIEVVANKNYFVLQMFDTALLLLQGLFNVMIYLRPRVRQYRRSHPNTRWWRVLWNVNDSRRASVARLSDMEVTGSTLFQARRWNVNDTEADGSTRPRAFRQTHTALETEAGDSTIHSTVTIVQGDEETSDSTSAVERTTVAEEEAGDSTGTVEQMQRDDVLAAR